LPCSDPAAEGLVVVIVVFFGMNDHLIVGGRTSLGQFGLDVCDTLVKRHRPSPLRGVGVHMVLDG